MKAAARDLEKLVKPLKAMGSNGHFSVSFEELSR